MFWMAVGEPFAHVNLHIGYRHASVQLASSQLLL